MIEKVVIITGASSGIGKACALRFADKNTAIVIAARADTRDFVAQQS